MIWLVETLVASTALMVLVLLVRGRVAEIFGARAAYLLWLLPAARMVLPPLPESFGPAPIAQLPAFVPMPVEFAFPVEALPPVEAGLPWGTILVAAWLGGAALLLAWQLFAYHRFVGGVLAQATDLPEMDSGGIEVCASPVVEGPFAAGILTPTVVLPHDWKHRYTRDELALALRHETVHHLRGDLGINFVALLILALHWFNPIAWMSWRAFRTDQELACDAVVLDGAGPEQRHSYGLALVKSACPRTPVAACSLNPRDQLKRRLRMMRAGADRRVSGRALAIALTAGGLALTASGGIAAEATQEIGREVEAQVIAPAVAAVAQVAPLPPVAPPSPVAPPAETDEPVEAPEPPEPPELPDPPQLADEAANDAMRDAREAVPEAKRELKESRRDVTHSFAMARGTALECKQARGKLGETAFFMRRADGKSERRVIRYCMPDIDSADFRAIRVDALKSAREGMLEARKLERERLAAALAGIDAEIARLKQLEALGK